MWEVKKKTFRSITNSGVKNKSTVIYIKGDLSEDGIIIETKYLVPLDMMEDMLKINTRYPTFFILRKTNNYCLVVARSQSFKLSSFNKIIEIVNNINNEQASISSILD